MHVLVVAHSQALRAGLKVLLSESPDGGAPALVVQEAANLAEAEDLAAEADILVVAADLDWLSTWIDIAEGATRPSLLWLTDSPQAAQALAGRSVQGQLRAWGLLPSDATGEELRAAVNALNEGLIVGAPSLLAPTLNRPLSTIGLASDVPSFWGNPAEALTEREREVLGLLAQGLANKQIAAALGISEHTVKFHVSSIYTKLGVASRTEAVREGVKRGIVTL
jgi:two-component system, NarL family, response regulator YdfI